MESRHSCEPAQLRWLSRDSQENWGKLEARAAADVVNSEFCFLLHRQRFMHLKPMNPTEDIYNSLICGWVVEGAEGAHGRR